MHLIPFVLSCVLVCKDQGNFIFEVEGVSKFQRKSFHKGKKHLQNISTLKENVQLPSSSLKNYKAVTDLIYFEVVTNSYILKKLCATVPYS